MELEKGLLLLLLLLLLLPLLLLQQHKQPPPVLQQKQLGGGENQAAVSVLGETVQARLPPFPTHGAPTSLTSLLSRRCKWSSRRAAPP